MTDPYGRYALDLMWARDARVERMPEHPKAAELIEAGCGWASCDTRPEYIIFSKEKDFIAPVCRVHTARWLGNRVDTVDGHYGYYLPDGYLASECARLGLP